MIWLDIPLPPQALPFYLAAEEWAASAMAGREVFFCWQPERDTVICGRHQQIDVEVNLDYCRKEGIEVFRRRSGGGCVYSGKGNLMFSFVVPAREIAPAFTRCTTMLASALRSMDIQVHVSGRNDIVLNEHKISGCAYYQCGDCGIVHGTLLCDLRDCRMGQAITPSRAKIESKGVTSVESRVTSLADNGIDTTPAEMAQALKRELCGGSLTLMDSEIEQIHNMSRRYYDNDFRWQKRHRGTHTHRRHWDGVGEVVLDYNTDAQGLISDINLSGDFFATDDLPGMLNALRGVPPEQSAVGKVLSDYGANGPIQGLSASMLADTFPNQ